MRISIRLKILISFVVCSLIVMVVAIGGMYLKFKNIMIDNVSTEISDMLTDKSGELNRLISKIKSCGEYVGINQIICEAAVSSETDQFLKQENTKVFTREIQSTYELLIDADTSDYGMIFYANRELPIAASFLDSTYGENSLTLSIYNTDGLQNEPWYIETLEKDGELHIFTNEYEGLMFFARKIDMFYPRTQETFLGVSVVCIDFEMILRELESKSMTQGMTFAISANGSGVIAKSAHSPEDDYIAEVLKNNPVSAHEANTVRIDDYLINTSKTDTGICLLSFTSVSEVTALALANKSIIIAPLLLTLFLLVFMAIFLSFILNKPLKTLVMQLDGLSGERITKLEMNGERRDEVGDLYRAINSLIDKVNMLVEEIEISARKGKELEIKMHQMKITPHFLYNTLDSIFWKAEMSGQSEIAVMVSNLSNIFEYSIRGDELTAPLSEEVAMLEKYVEIQKKRGLGNIVFSYDIEASGDIDIPKNILQPLVENSIIHGCSGVSPLDIFLWAETNGSVLKIYLQDNGKGNCAESLNSYLAGDESILKGGKIGISNVNKRLSFIYGEGSGLRYENNADGGLTAILFIILN